MGKDKIIGLLIILVAVVLIIGYTIIGPIDLYAESHAGTLLDTSTQWLRNISGMNWKWAVVGPLWLVVLLVGVIAIWIGFSMVTTPPPLPLEELEEELEAEEEKSE
ncbi:MAG: hypothetical protein ACTSU2_10750 [Promethearchaeota archaeon]